MALTFDNGQSLWTYANDSDNSAASTAQFADFDGDGDLDIFIGVEKMGGAQASQIWKNDGAGNFSLGYTFPASRTVKSWAVDVDGDGDKDLITRGNDAPVEVWKNNGSGAFSLATSTIGYANDAEVADLNGDGHVDIVVALKDGGFQVYKNGGSGSFTSEPIIPGAAFPPGISLADLDKDGDLDLVTIEADFGRILLNDGSGSFTVSSQFGNEYGMLTRAADVTNDGYADVLVNGINGSSQDYYLYQNDGSGGLGTQLQVFPMGTFPLGFADVDGDGDLDGLGTKLFLNTNGIFADSGLTFTDGAFMYQGALVDGQVLAAGDVDGDGDMDLAVAFYAGDWYIPSYAGGVKIFINNFTPPTNVDGSLNSASGVAEPVGLHASADTAAEAVNVFDFQLTDGGGGDAVGLQVSTLVVHTSGSGDFSKVTWRLNGLDASNATGTYDAVADTITFSGLNIVVNDAESETYTINAYFNDTAGLANGQTYQLSIDGDTDVTVLPTGTRMAAGQTAVTNGGGSVVTVNVAPTATNLAQTLSFTEDQVSNVALNDIVISDADVGDTLTATLTLGNAAAGALTTGTFGAATSSYNAGTGIWTVTGTQTDVNAALAAVAFAPAANWDQNVTITTQVRDAASAGPLNGSITLNVTAVNDAPTLANPVPNQNATEDTAFSFQLPADTFADVDTGDTLTYTAQLAAGGVLPAWLTFNATTRTFSGTPANGDVGTLSITVTANDSHGPTVTDTFDIVVANTNDAPTVANAIANQNATEDSAFSFQFDANTFADVDAGDALTYTAQLAGGGPLPGWLVFDAGTRTFSGTPLNGNVGTLSIEVIAEDSGNATASDIFDIVVANTNDAPTVANAIGNQNATEDAAFNFQVPANTFADVDVGDTLSYSAQLTGGATLPIWLIFDPATRTFSGTPDNSAVGTLSIEVIASDGNNASVTETFAILVANTNDAPTVANVIADQNATEDTAFSFQFNGNTFADVDVGDTLSYSAQLTGGAALPAWLSFDPATRTFSGTPTNDDVGNLSIEVIANDGSGSVTDTFTISVANANDAPTVVNVIDDQNATEDAIFSFQIDAGTFADADVGDTLSYSAQLTGGAPLPTWLSFDEATRTFSGTPDNSAVGTLSIDVIANDGNNGSVTEIFVIEVANTNDAPTVAMAIPDRSATAGSAFNFQFAANSFLDIDVGDVLAYTTELTGGGALPAWLSFDPATRTFSGTPVTADIGTLSIDVTADDGNGGTVSETFNLVVTRPVPPVTPTDPTPVPVDGVPVTTTPGDGGTTIISIPVVAPSRPDTPGTPSPLADIPLVKGSDGHSILQVSVPVGVGLQAQGLAQPLTGAAALAELGLRIERSAGGDAGLTNNGQVFLATLDPSVPLTIQTITATAGSGFNPDVPLVISGSAIAGDGMQAVILDARALPDSTTIQVDNVDFLAVVGAVRIVGGAGQNMASGDGAAQYIVLGADDDIIHGGGGNDTVGSKGGNDQIYGDAGDDIVFGGAGNDLLSGGSGSDRLNGGTGFDVAIQEGKRTDYTVTLDGAGIKLTHVASGVSDWLVDVEQVRFATGPSLTVAHSAAEEAAAFLFQQWMGRDLTQSEGAVIQTLAGQTALQVAELFAQVFPQQAGGRTAEQLLDGMAGAGAIRVDAARATTFTGDAGDNTFTPAPGLAWSVDGGAGIDTIVFPATLAHTHLEASATGFTLQRMTDGAMLELVNVERLTLSDTKLALDLDGHAGQAAKLIGAVGGAALLDNKPLVGEVIRALDAGISAQSLAQLGLQLLGAQTAGQVTQLLWTNVVGSAATPAQLQPFVDMMAQGMTGGELAVLAGNLDLTAMRIDLVGLAATGIEFA